MSISVLVDLLALVSIGMFIVGLKKLAQVRTSREGNAWLSAAMGLAVAITLIGMEFGAGAPAVDYRWILAGLVVGGLISVRTVLKAKATAMPEIVARFNGFGGAASALVAMSLFWLEVVETDLTVSAAEALDGGGLSAATLVISVLVGSVTFSGSVVAELKLRGTLRGAPQVPARALLMGLLTVGGLAAGSIATFTVVQDGGGALLVAVMLALSLLIGIVLVVPIGGADMPVVISLLNSASGLAAASTGFALGNNLLIVAGTAVGAAGLILTQVMCVAMNRSLLNVLIGGVGQEIEEDEDAATYSNIISSSPEEAVMVLEAASSVIIVPGYGLAAARAQHTAHEFAKLLSERGVDVRFAIHPVAGRMPGHMNVVLAEADVPYEQLFEMDQINHEFKNTDVALVVGANDVVNPAAREAQGSPISGMPILNVDEAQRVFIIKRSLSPGYAGIKNELFEYDNTVMLFGDAKDMLHEINSELEATAPAGV